ncbi:unnamed protein product [Cunninghamella blakesleeana]
MFISSQSIIIFIFVNHNKQYGIIYSLNENGLSTMLDSLLKYIQIIASFSLTHDGDALKTYRGNDNKTISTHVQITYCKYLLQIASPSHPSSIKYDIGIGDDYAHALEYIGKAASKGFEPATKQLNVPQKILINSPRRPSSSSDSSANLYSSLYGNVQLFNLHHFHIPQIGQYDDLLFSNYPRPIR